MFGMTRLKVLPWLLLFEAANTLRAHLTDNLSPEDRRRVVRIVRDAKGDPRKVAARDRDELRAIAGRLDLLTLARDLVPLAGRASGKRGRRY
jgi:hypothetical protein